MQKPKSYSLNKALTYTSLLLGSIACVLLFIDYADPFIIGLAIIGLLAGVVAYILSKKINAPKRIIIAGMILSLLCVVLSLYQFSNTVEPDKIPVPEETPVKNEAFIKSVDSSLNDIESSLKALEKDSVK